MQGDPRRFADQGMRAVNAPAGLVARGGGKDLILLRATEVFDVQPTLILAEGCLGQGAALILMFSASVSCRSQLVRNTCVGLRPASA